MIIIGVVATAMVSILRSYALDGLFPYPLMEQTAPRAWAYVLPWAFFLFVGIAVRGEHTPSSEETRPTFEQGMIATCITLLLLLGSLVALHPSHATFAALVSFGARFPHAGDPLLNALVGGLLVLPSLTLPLIVLPLSLLRHRWAGVGLSVLGIIGFLLFPVLEAIYFGVTGPPLVSAVQGILRLLPEGVPVDLNRWQVGYGDFRVTVGYACTEFSSVVLLMSLWGVAVHARARTAHISLLRAILIFIAGIVCLWTLNSVRIATIVLIGSFHREFALHLFHSGIGLVLFLLFFLFFVRWALPWVTLDAKKEC